MTDIDTRMLDREFKKGRAELLLLTLVAWQEFIEAINRITRIENA